MIKKMRLLCFCSVLALVTISLKAADLTLKLDVDPLVWKLHKGHSIKVKFVATVFNATDEEKRIVLYDDPELTLSKARVEIHSGGGADMPAPIDASDIVLIPVKSSFTWTYFATLQRDGNELQLVSGNQKHNTFWHIHFSDGKYSAVFHLVSFTQSFLKNNLDAPTKAKIWTGSIDSEPQIITADSR